MAGKYTAVLLILCLGLEYGLGKLQQSYMVRSHVSQALPQTLEISSDKCLGFGHSKRTPNFGDADHRKSNLFRIEEFRAQNNFF